MVGQGRIDTVVAGIGVDDDTNGAEFLRQFDLEPAEDQAVSADDNLAGDVDTVRGEMVKILISTVVGVNVFCRNIATVRTRRSQFLLQGGIYNIYLALYP